MAKTPKAFESSFRLAIYRLANVCCVVLLASVTLLNLAKYIPQYAGLVNHVQTFAGSDYVLHWLGATTLTLCSAWLLRVHRFRISRAVFYFVFCLALFALDEFLQGLSPIRASTLEDVKFSSYGWATAVAIWTVFYGFFKYNES